MARKKAEPVYTGRYTADEMTQIDADTLSRMGRSELAKVVSRMADVSKKRMKRLEQNEEYTPAYYGFKEKYENGELSVKGKSLNELRAMFKHHKGFLTAKTSTIKGARATKKAEEERLGITFRSKDESKLFWKIYDKFLETSEGKQALYNKGSLEFQQILAEMVVSEQYSEDEILARLQAMYEDDNDEYDDVDMFDDFYDLDDI